MHGWLVERKAVTALRASWEPAGRADGLETGSHGVSIVAAALPSAHPLRLEVDHGHDRSVPSCSVAYRRARVST